MIISVHLPKTAGTSFYKLLDDHFNGLIKRDYKDVPLNKSISSRRLQALLKCLSLYVINPKKINCIHGHFMPLKYFFYRSQSDVKFVTWMRNPVERLASHYFHWLRTYDVSTSPLLHRRVVEEKWSLERFCLGPEMKNMYSQFLWFFPLTKFDFVGITEFYESELEYFCGKFVGEMRGNVSYEENRNQKNNNKPYVANGDFRTAIEKHHSDDMKLYKQALDLRTMRLMKNGMQGL